MRGTLLLLLLLPYLCSCSSGCNTELHDDVDFPGSDIKFVHAPDVHVCQQICTQHHSCLFFTFIRADWTRDKRNFYCYLKRTRSGNPKRKIHLHGVTSGFSLKSCLINPECHPELLENEDFPGCDIKIVHAADVFDCQRFCTNHDGCLFFTFIRGDWTKDNRNYYCYLKSTQSGQPPQKTYLHGVTSGFSLRPCFTNTVPCFDQRYRGIDFPGVDYRLVVLPTFEQCQRACTVDPSCQFFTWVNDQFRIKKLRLCCFLKTVPALPIPPKVKLLENVESGFPQRCFNP